MSNAGQQTIAAIATPPGPGGIGIIKISGPASLSILNKLFTPKKRPEKFISHRLYYGWLTDPDSSAIVDEVMAVFMQAPFSYTCEDVVEIHSHCNFVILQEIVALILKVGARLAAPGEFTKTAFLNGRLDLTRAEAVLDLINAKTDQSRNLAIHQMQGVLHQEIIGLRDALVAIKAIIEVAIDFPEDDVEIINSVDLSQRLTDTIIPGLKKLISTADNGKIYREGISVVIIGRPNVGKSSLLNALLREDRAIVTKIPGTTRDTIEEYINIKGIPVRIIDTAGIRNSTNSVEEIGIQRSKNKLSQADLVILLFDSSVPLEDQDIQLFDLIKDKPLILVANKNDIGSPGIETDYRQKFPSLPLVSLSAKFGQGITALEEAIFTEVTGQAKGWDPGHTAVPNTRQQSALTLSLAKCQCLLQGLEHNLSPDLLAIELQGALDDLGDIVGITTTDDVLDMIFSQFCIGK